MGSESLIECPFCRELVKEQASKCYHCQSWIRPGGAVLSPCYRPRYGRTVWGVCAGVAKRTGYDVTIVRLVFIALFLLGGHGLTLYIVLRLLMPDEPDAAVTATPQAA